MVKRSQYKKKKRKTKRNKKTNKKNKKNKNNTIKRIKKKTKKIKRTKNRINNKIKTIKDKYNIQDIPLSKEKNLGTNASSNIVDYHYQHLLNLVDFFNKLRKRNIINNVGFFDNDAASLLRVNIKRSTVEPIYGSKKDYIYNLTKCLHYRFIPITIDTRALQNYSEYSGYDVEMESHANTILIDTKNKQIELFEPHGYKPKKSTSSTSVSNYHKKRKLLIQFFKDFLPEFKFINVVDYIKDKSFQKRYDANSGYCVTWSALYIHYRILNPDVPIKILLQYINLLVNTVVLLRYAKYIEDVLKNKK